MRAATTRMTRTANLPGPRRFFLAAVFAMGAVSLAQTERVAAASDRASPAKPAAYSAAQFAAVQTMVDAASAASGALAGEELTAWEKARTGLGAAIKGLAPAFGADGFNGRLKTLAGAWPALEQAADIAHARAAYLKVSDNLAQIVLETRAADTRLAKVVVYYCMDTADPANARWVQLAAPLANPFWGVHMDKMGPCCAEVKP